MVKEDKHFEESEERAELARRFGLSRGQAADVYIIREQLGAGQAGLPYARAVAAYCAHGCDLADAVAALFDQGELRDTAPVWAELERGSECCE